MYVICVNYISYTDTIKGNILVWNLLKNSSWMSFEKSLNNYQNIVISTVSKITKFGLS